MRIIDQYGIIDIPYEQYSFILIKKPDSYAIRTNENETIMAKYLTEEKAKIALDMLHDAYKRNQLMAASVVGCVYRDMPEEKQANWECYLERVRESYVWQFPVDDEIEV